MLAPYTIPYAGMIRIRFPGASLLWAGSSRQGLRAALARTVSQPLVGAPLGAGTLWRGKEESKQFFFEKNNQKTFIRAVAVLCVTARRRARTFFGGLSKKHACLASSADAYNTFNNTRPSGEPNQSACPSRNPEYASSAFAAERVTP